MRRFVVALLMMFCAHLALHAAVVEGVVLDEETGNPLARTQVTLVPLPGTQAELTDVRTGARGSFVILSVMPGWYVVRATRRGYAPAESGQLRAGRPGHAFEVAENRVSGFIEIKMSHLPAITGTLLDENGVGMAKWPVHILSTAKPVRHVAQTVTDERGNYRVGELTPGSYFVRSGPGPLEDGTTLLATYSKNAVEMADAVGTSVHVGETAHDIVVRPVKGKLLTLTGMLIPVPLQSATLTLVTDTGRQEVGRAFNLATPFTAREVQPGPVELIVKGQDQFGKDCGSYTRLTVDKDVTGMRLACAPFGPDSFSFVGARLRSPATVRRVDLDGASETHPLATDELLAPGHWELSVPPGDYYVVSVRNFGSAAGAHNGEWWGFDASTYTRITVTLSSTPGTISGVVSTGGNPVAGAPVFLANSIGSQTWMVRADPQGNYRFGGLAPGEYSIVSGFDVDMNEVAWSRKPDTVSVAEGNTSVHALELVLP